MSSLLLVNITQVFPPAANFTSVASLANVLIPNLFFLAGLLFFIMILAAGLSFLRSGGNPEGLKKAQQLLTTSIIGLIIVLSSYLLVKLTCRIFAVNLCLGL